MKFLSFLFFVSVLLQASEFRDPFAPPVRQRVVKSAETVSKPLFIKLTGVVDTEDEAMAIIVYQNIKRFVTIDDVVAGYHVTSITDDQVILSSSEKEITLILGRETRL